MKKRIISLLLAIVAVFALTIPAAASGVARPIDSNKIVYETQAKAKFYDLDMVGKWAYAPIGWAVEQNVTQGVNKHEFFPNTACSRSEIVTFLWRMAGSRIDFETFRGFSDVPSNTWYFNAVAWATSEQSNHLTSGTSSTTFSPGAFCTRGQIVTFLWRFYGSPKVSGGTQFNDVPSNAFYATDVKWAAKNHITSGTSSTTFSPDGYCTRAEAVAFLYRAALTFGTEPLQKA